MRNPMLAAPVASNYQFAVYSGAYQVDLTIEPEQPRALFADAGMAARYGALMWPGTFEVIDVLTGKPVCE